MRQRTRKYVRKMNPGAGNEIDASLGCKYQCRRAGAWQEAACMVGWPAGVPLASRSREHHQSLSSSDSTMSPDKFKHSHLMSRRSAGERGGHLGRGCRWSVWRSVLSVPWLHRNAGHCLLWSHTMASQF